jgi:hypothetical protein
MGASLSISITQNSQDVAANTSNVTVAVKIAWTYGSYNRNQKPGWLKIDGTKYDFTSDFNYNKATSGSETIFTKTVNVTHNDTGAKTLACSASYTTGVSAGTITASASKTLTTIPRATTPTLSASSVDMGAKVSINTPRAASAFTHDLAYSFAGGSYVSIANGVGTSYSWTTPDLASQVPNATSGTVTVRCITKNGSTTIGTKTVTMTLKVPSTVVPTVSSITAAETVDGLAAQFGAFVQNKSKIKFTIAAAGAKGSTIKSYSTKVNGATYTGASFTVSLAAASLSVAVTVTDSRGRTASKSMTYTVLGYTVPAINVLQVSRVDAAGNADPNGDRVAVRYKYAVAALRDKNTASMAMEYKRSTATDWEELLTGSALSADTTAKPASPVLSSDYQYDVRLTVTDWFGSTATRTAVLPSGAVILDIRADGLGLGLFTTSTREGVDFGKSAKGAVLGLWEATGKIPENGDFNEWLQPGVYAVESNAIMLTLKNRPCDRGGTLRVSSGLGAAKIAGAYAYMVQEFHPYHNEEPIYRRHLMSDASGVFTPGPWKPITLRGQKILWSGTMYMTAGHVAELSEPVSRQDNGIVLVFSTYQNGAAVDSNFNHFFVPKKFVEIMGGYGNAFQMNTVNFSTLATKYLYIHDDNITGNENNNLSGTATSGITFNNAMYVLRYVLGV